MSQQYNVYPLLLNINDLYNPIQSFYYPFIDGTQRKFLFFNSPRKGVIYQEYTLELFEGSIRWDINNNWGIGLKDNLITFYELIL